MANGWSSREKSRLSVRRVHQVPRQDENSMAITAVAPSDEEIVDVKPLQVSRDMVHIPGPKRSNLSLDKLIMEAITCLKENGGSNKTAIAAFIEGKNVWLSKKKSPSRLMSKKSIRFRNPVHLELRDLNLFRNPKIVFFHTPVFFCLSFAQLSSPFSYLLQFKSCLSISGSQLLHCCALSPIFYLIFFISSLLVGLLGFCFSFCDGYSSSLDICCAGCAGTFFFFCFCSFSVHLCFSEQNMSMRLIGDAYIIFFRDLGPILGTARLKKYVVCKIKVFDSKWKTDQGLTLVFQVNRKYRIAPIAAYSDRRRNSSVLYLEGRQKASMKIDRDETNILTRSQIDLELEKIRSMTPQEAAAFAARAVAEAEAAIAEAEEAAKEAEAAEADAEAAQAFADATTKSAKGRKSPKRVKKLFSPFFPYMIL
ncbi:Telomere repeat-binding factor 1 [Glycine soja]|uniref:Telomere repeat-binding factor 1 n=1 Tax=Glycine soja TaxID=3848 RepID=A0A445IW62_GLYSO|nr:Telomere repeat-binding factor 1 [Glycine soja]